jgi:hypothetical protein
MAKKEKGLSNEELIAKYGDKKGDVLSVAKKMLLTPNKIEKSAKQVAKKK